MKQKQLLKPVLAALFAALCCVCSLVVQIPSGMGGYVNLGDCVVLTSGWLLGGAYGFLAAGLGSMLADIFTGYAHYAIGTFLIKGLAAVLAVWSFRLFSAMLRSLTLSRIFSALASELFMVAGYFFYTGLFLGKGVAAITGIPGDLVQGAVGIVTSVLLTRLLLQVDALRGLMDLKK